MFSLPRSTESHQDEPLPPTYQEERVARLEFLVACLLEKNERLRQQLHEAKSKVTEF